MQLIDHLGHHGAPTGLVGSTHTAAVVTMEVFVEQDQVAPMGVVLEEVHVAVEGTPAQSIASEDSHQATLQLQRGIPEVDPVAGAGTPNSVTGKPGAASTLAGGKYRKALSKLCSDRPICLRLFEHCIRLAASRAA